MDVRCNVLDVVLSAVPMLPNVSQLVVAVADQLLESACQSVADHHCDWSSHRPLWPHDSQLQL